MRQSRLNVIRAFLLIVGIFFAAAFGNTSANASTVTWILSTNIALSDGGTLNGYFVINAQSGFINGNPFDLTTAGGSTNFNQDYNATINASDPNSLTVEFFAPNPAYSSSLTLVFLNSLLIASQNNPIVGGIGGPSFECEGYSCTANNTRYVVSGSASATPLPAALPLFASGLGVIGLVARRRKRKTTAIAA